MADDEDVRGIRGRDLVGLGGLLVGGTVGGTLIGLLVDNLLDSAPVGTLIGLVVGATLGIVSCVQRIRRALGG
jgi:F0F1-type ATP synthase assembly protein I